MTDGKEKDEEIKYFVIVYEMCPRYTGSMRDWVWMPALTPEDALEKFNKTYPSLVKAGICMLYVAKVIK